MQLNLPILDQLSNCKNVLIAGMGGGFDLFCGLPIYFALQERGQNAHLANFSFADISFLIQLDLDTAGHLTETLMRVIADLDFPALYFPELHLANWFREERDEEVAIWAFHKTGARPLLENYRRLVEHLDIDGIVLLDGGVDSLMRGDEPMPGTLLEDSISLAAVNELDDVPVRLIGCLGMGAEREVSHFHALENMAELTEAGAYLGSCGLVKAMEAYHLYEDAVLYVQDRQQPSVINSSIVSAVRGHFDNYHLTARTRDSGSRLWISPLMTLYWFFDLPMVAQRNLLLDQLLSTDTMTQALRVAYQVMTNVEFRRGKRQIPLP